MSSAVLLGGRSADIQEFGFQAAKLSEMDCAELQWGLFTDWQEWYLQVEKRSHKNSTILQDGRWAATR